MATLVSVNVGLPKDVAWQGRTVHTGVWKAPVDGPVMLRRTNLDGDGQGDLAGHGGEQRAVLVYQLDSYRHWRDVLDRDDLAPGAFGENFTVDGLPDDEVCVGDRFRVGGALVEVTQPRVTCYRVGMRLGEPRLPALLVAHHRPGFYLRVLREGAVRAGDELVKVADGPEHVTVAEIDALLYLPGHDRAAVARALRVDALSPGWKGSLRALLEEPEGRPGNPGLGPVAPPPAWAGFRPLVVTGVHQETADVTSLRLAAPDGAPLPPPVAGQFLTVRLAAGLVRSYSLSGPPGGASYRISVKLEPGGAGGTFLREHVRAGTTLDTAAPRGAFTLDRSDRPVLLVSAGIGATPLLAMLHDLAGHGSGRAVWWLHGARDGAGHAFAGEVRALLTRLPSAREVVCYSRPRPQDRPGVDYTRAGRLDAGVLSGLDLPPSAVAYVCGPAGFMDDVTAGLTAAGIVEVHREQFTALAGSTPGISAATAGPPRSRPGPGPTVTFARSGVTAGWSDGDGSVLALAEDCRVPVRWSCRTGVCHSCETGLLSGEVESVPEPLDPPAAGTVLICCARPRTDLVLDL
ncbi:MOSC domain-containing protein [Dactylosporangium aurantiacum]|uniref:MOSC domain-containing protein n=1 Tax=Dactylosporangium aurantiacum TaxID=35754 RepID=A0A9Q9MM13_9ACTN|nr:MOSC and FAD-binding oxidoreductase domain-containing protein [Dactylosporangium aurantiacum]MDG6103069.1 MOSC and FAD-binding oxidoreductase domain-containing protein [Dactylosporangium aurantiacum]UWZ57581.1 MOSC domain-containing protein [Dactylosporangium aurantiacum]